MQTDGLSIEEAVVACISLRLGSELAMSQEFERNFVQFLKEAERMNLHRCWQKAAEDVHNYLVTNGMTVSVFNRNKPG